MPSMPMLTTPDRSLMTPHSAAKAIGIAAATMIGAMNGRTVMRKPRNWMTKPRIGIWPTSS